MLPTVSKRLGVSLYVNHGVTDTLLIDAVGLIHEFDIVKSNVIPELICFFISPVLCDAANLHVGF